MYFMLFHIDIIISFKFKNSFILLIINYTYGFILKLIMTNYEIITNPT